MKTIIKRRWVILSLWLAATILLTIFQPNINDILQQRGQTPLSSNSLSVIADSMLKKMEKSVGTSNIIVFYDKNKITSDEMSRIGEVVTKITNDSYELGISDIIDPFSKPAAKSSLVSEDGTTLIVSFKLDKGSREISDIKNQLESKLTSINVEHYFTGSDFINDDYLKASVSGVEKSGVLTVLFILIILILMFRSIITPLVSLLAVAFSYLTSMGIAAQLIDKANFPVTTLTQILLILVLFGIGTDYNILLFNRFKEELSHGVSTDDAIINTYKTAGKTIAFSILTVLIAFLSLIFSESPIYKSGIVVVIGAAVLLLEIITLTPFAMKTLGNKIFWPSRNTAGHKESKLWGKITTYSTKHSIISILMVVLIIGTTIVFYQQKLNFDTIGELGNSYPSSKGFNIISEHFGKGQAMPSALVIESNGAMDKNKDLSVIDKLTESIKKIDGVKQVSSVTQPQGKQIDDFYISNQLSSVTSGFSSMQDGLNQIGDGLIKAQDKLGSADFSKVNDMVDGTAELQKAMSALTSGLSQLKAGLANDSQNPATISNGIASIESSLQKMSSGIALLTDNYKAMQSGYAEMGKQYQGAANALLGIKATLSQMQTMLGALGSSYKNIVNDSNYVNLKASMDSLISSLSNITPEGIEALNSNYNKTTAGFDEANKNLKVMSSGLSQMAIGLKKIESGLNKASYGIGTIVTNMNRVTQGLNDMKSGQEKLVSGLNGFSSFGEKMAEVTSALKNIPTDWGRAKIFWHN